MYQEMQDSIGLVQAFDPEVAAAMSRELTRQRQNIELIASENIVSRQAVLWRLRLRGPGGEHRH